MPRHATIPVVTKMLFARLIIVRALKFISWLKRLYFAKYCCSICLTNLTKISFVVAILKMLIAFLISFFLKLCLYDETLSLPDSEYLP